MQVITVKGSYEQARQAVIDNLDQCGELRNYSDDYNYTRFDVDSDADTLNYWFCDCNYIEGNQQFPIGTLLFWTTL